MPVIDTPQALARQLSDDVGLGSGRLTAATIRAVVAALVVLDDELLGLCLGADVWPDDRGPARPTPAG